MAVKPSMLGKEVGVFFAKTDTQPGLEVFCRVVEEKMAFGVPRYKVVPLAGARGWAWVRKLHPVYRLPGGSWRRIPRKDARP
jgi:hypothetical protein